MNKARTKLGKDQTLRDNDKDGDNTMKQREKPNQEAKRCMQLSQPPSSEKPTDFSKRSGSTKLHHKQRTNQKKSPAPVLRKPPEPATVEMINGNFLFREMLEQ
ncbi:hypothetical protein BRARA_B00477 [Brassica rapa]|uniref:Uncharacterized protein n=1 Tax=Brassica campestris TaxID=3711 RepID=A0A398A679_BRACM|nr:hypothetical protein BRARA_B00477 [Brassica rapa]